MPKLSPISKEELHKKALRNQSKKNREKRPAIPTGLRYYFLTEIAYEARLSYNTIRKAVKDGKLEVFGYVTDGQARRKTCAVVLEDEAKRFLLSRIMVKKDMKRYKKDVAKDPDNS